MPTHSRRVCLLSALAVCFAAPAIAGPLDPPAGAVSPSFKTLTEVEPRIAISAANTPGDTDSQFKISQPGSYYLAGNIAGVAGKHGIKIVSSGVTIDLGGFDMVGAASNASLSGITVVGSGLSNVSVVNGSVRSWGGIGVDIQAAANTRVERVTSSRNNGAGIVTGVNNNGGPSIITGCIVANNGGGLLDGGIMAGRNSTISGCTSTANVHGIMAGTGSTITDCSAQGAIFNGFYLYANASATACTATSNGGHGFFTLGASTFSRCNSTGNTNAGYSCNAGSTLLDCVAASNTDAGVTAGDTTRVSGCSIHDNQSLGIRVTQGSTVIDCTVRQNTGDGIQFTYNCLIRGNTCTNNAGASGAGIHAAGGPGAGYNRIEGNAVSNSAIGVRVETANNVIVRNICGSNAQNWNVAGINLCYVTTATYSGAAFTGNSGGNPQATADSNANFSY